MCCAGVDINIYFDIGIDAHTFVSFSITIVQVRMRIRSIRNIKYTFLDTCYVYENEYK